MTKTRQDQDIDKKVRNLVEALNRLKGVWTYSSCGGHSDPNECQAPKNQFYVCFNVSRSSKGWRALDVIAWAVYEASSDAGLPDSSRKALSVEIWHNSVGGCPPARGTSSFEMRGKNVHPDRVTRYLVEYLSDQEARRD